MLQDEHDFILECIADGEGHCPREGETTTLRCKTYLGEARLRLLGLRLRGEGVEREGLFADGHVFRLDILVAGECLHGLNARLAVAGRRDVRRHTLAGHSDCRELACDWLISLECNDHFRRGTTLVECCPIHHVPPLRQTRTDGAIPVGGVAGDGRRGTPATSGEEECEGGEREDFLHSKGIIAASP